MASQRLQTLFQKFQTEAQFCIGYPGNADFDYQEVFRFLQFSLNNIGDPFLESNYKLNTHDIEREVISTFSGWAGLPEEKVWGYVTNGGTEGNLYAMFLARELNPGGILYYSEESHYSVDKIIRLLGMKSMMIRSLSNGQMDLEDLEESLRINRTSPAIVFANIGTTMKGAIDDVEGIRGLFRKFAITRSYLHADAALSGMILPFVSEPDPWNFSAGVDSVAISGHKMIGSPIPCGIVLAKRENVSRVSQSVEYIGSLDTTISGSRGGIQPLLMWHRVQSLGEEGFRKQVSTCLEMADHAVTQLQKLGLHAWRHKNSNTVVFDRPSTQIVQKWQLAVQAELAHVITMPHVKQGTLELFFSDIRAEQKGRKEQKSQVSSGFGEAAPSSVPPLSKKKLRAKSENCITLVGPAQAGRLLAVSQALTESGIDIESFEARQVEDVDVITFQVSDGPLARRLLASVQQAGKVYGYSENTPAELALYLNSASMTQLPEDTVLTHIDDTAGALATLTEHLNKQGASSFSLKLLFRSEGQGTVAIGSEDTQKVAAALRKGGYAAFGMI